MHYLLHRDSNDFEQKISRIESSISRGVTVLAVFSNDQKSDNLREYDFLVTATAGGKIVLEGLRRKRRERSRAIGMGRSSRNSTKENVITLKLTHDDARKLCGSMFEQLASLAMSVQKQLGDAENKIKRLERVRDLNNRLNLDCGVWHKEHGYGTLLKLDEDNSKVRFEDDEHVVDTLSILDSSWV